MASSPTLRELRGLVPVLTVEVHNSVALQEYYALVRSLHEQLTANTKARDDDKRQYLDLKVWLCTCTAIEQHNGQDKGAFLKDKLWLKREFRAMLEKLEAVAERIVARENSERRLHEDLFDLFDGTTRDEGRAALDFEQCMQILSIAPASRKPASGVPTRSTTTAAATAATNFDSLRRAIDASSPPAIYIGAVSPAAFSYPYPCIVANSAPTPSAPSQPLQGVVVPSTSPIPIIPVPMPPPLVVVSGSSSSSSTLGGRAILRVISPHAFNCSAVLLGLQPFVSQFELRLPLAAGSLMYFRRFDHHVSFVPFLRAIPPGLQISRGALETNRCFFIHLGLAMKIHPFALQQAFRRMALHLLPLLPADSPALDIVPTINEYAGFVDANCLCYLWPQEFAQFRICIISNPASAAPMFSCFSSSGKVAKFDILVHCDGSHFTLLQPMHSGTPQFSLSQLLTEASHAGCVVQQYACQNLCHLKTLAECVQAELE